MSHAPDEFEKAARREERGGFVLELLRFLRASRKWWLIPVIATLLLVAVLVLLSSSAAAPFVYTLF